MEDRVEDLDVRRRAGGVRTIDPHEVLPKNTHPNLVSEGGLPRVLVGREGVPCGRGPHLWHPKVCHIDD